MPNDINLSQWLSTMYQDYTTGRAQKEEMFGRGVGALESYADIFRPGGEYGAGVEAMIGRGEKKAVASGYQNLVSAGLSNTTMPMHLQQTYQEEIGMPTRLRSEDVRMGRLGGALGSLGQMYAGYDSGAPSAGDIAHIATGGFGMQQTGRIADMNAQQAMYDRQARNQAGLTSQNMFGPSGGGTSGGGGGGGGTTPTTTQHRGGFTNPYGGGGGYGGGGFAEGDLPVMMGGQRIEPGSAGTKWADRERQLRETLAAGGHRAGESAQTTFDAEMRQLEAARAREGGAGDVFAPSTPIDDPFADYAARVSGISAYI